MYYFRIRPNIFVALHTELFTPMVHSNMTSLLEQVYQGRLGKEKTRMEEYGGKKMNVSVLPSKSTTRLSLVCSSLTMLPL